MNKFKIAGLGIVALAASFITGRTTAPTKTIEKTITVKSSQTEVAKNEHRDDTTKQAVLVRWKTRYVVRPDGTREETTESETANTSETDTSTGRAEASKTTEIKTVEVEKVRLVEAPRPRWAIAGEYGADLGGNQHFGGGVDMRIAGPVWVTARVDVPARAGLVGVRVEW